MSTPHSTANGNTSSAVLGSPANPITPTPSSTTSSSSQSVISPRRSLAHNPRLLGLNANQSLELNALRVDPPTDLASQITSNPSSSSASPLVVKKNVASVAQQSSTILFETPDEEDENILAAAEDEEPGQDSAAAQQKDSKKRGKDLTPLQIDPHAGLNGYQIEQVEGESSSLFKSHNHQKLSLDDSRDIEREAASYDRHIHDNIDNNYVGSDDDYDDVEQQTALLLFEPTTYREKSWMWFSVALVFVLTIVSIAIAVDWIDWPGDGIGKN
jgi:hypothetical protein